jgi:hypothetical protein
MHMDALNFFYVHGNLNNVGMSFFCWLEQKIETLSLYVCKPLLYSVHFKTSKAKVERFTSSSPMEMFQLISQSKLNRSFQI